MMKKNKVLIVDDNIINLKLACDILESDGYEVGRANSADEAFAVLELFSPDLILLDIGMPGMDGYMLARKLRSIESTKHFKIVALTASAMKGDDLKAYEAGFNGYLTKPIDTRKLGSQVSSFIDTL